LADARGYNPAEWRLSLSPLLLSGALAPVQLLSLPVALCVPVTAAAGGCVTRMVLSSPMARQEACSALQVPENCVALQEMLAEGTADDLLTQSLVHWLVALVIIRALVVVFDARADRAYRWTTLLAADTASLVIRLVVVVASVWQLTRLWDNSSALIESRVLAVAVALDAAVALVRVLRLGFFLYLYRVARRLFVHDPPTYLHCADVERVLSAPTGTSGPRVLRAQLVLLVREWEYISHHLRQPGHDTLRSGPTSVLWLPFTFFGLAAFLVSFAWFAQQSLRCPGRSAEAREDADSDFFSVLYGLFSWVCLSGHQNDPAIAALEDNLPDCACGKGNHYRRPPTSAMLGHTVNVLNLETCLRIEAGGGYRRMLALAHVLDHAEREPARRAQRVPDRAELTACWAAVTRRAPVERLVLNPVALSTMRVRLHALRVGLRWLRGGKRPTDRLGTAVLFGLWTTGGATAAAGAPSAALLVYGYWWSRTPATALCRDAVGAWLNAAPSVAPATGSPAREGPAVAAREGDRTSSALRRWRQSPDYARPLGDDWGSSDGALPRAWDELVGADGGGLAALAVFGLQAWMVVADVGLDGLGDLYLTLGAARQLSRGVDSGPAGGDGRPTGALVGNRDASEVATAEQLRHALAHPSASTQVARRLAQSSCGDVLPPAEGEAASRWPSSCPAPPTTLPPTPFVQQAQLAVLQRFLPDPKADDVAPLLVAVIATPLNINGCGHRKLAAEWQRRWSDVLAAACDLHGVRGEARAAVLDLLLIGFYPAMRVALDGLTGRWEPLAAAVLSRTGTIVGGWPDAVVTGLKQIRDCLHRCLWPANSARVAACMASLFLSQSAEEGGAYRQQLHVDIDSPTLRPPGAELLDASVAFAAVALTGYAATRGSDSGGGDVRLRVSD